MPTFYQSCSKTLLPATHSPKVKVEIINLEVIKQTTTDGPRGPGGSSRVQGGRDESESHSQKRRWIPPSTVHRDAVNDKARNDLIFRKVRGILNKLTPEKFQKLSDDLLQTELNSSVILKGVILLIFEKALDEPKYSSMYAQLCKRLSDEAPNYEEDSTRCTFRILLLNKCRAEFESRSEANEAFNRNRNGPLSPEDEERRQIAKRKMLGNIKFIGELGKLEICPEAILHHCIHQLLQEKNKQALSVNGLREATLKDMAEDLECLCQIMRTCGRILDQKGQKLMDQYFERMVRHSECFDQLPIRIRFMLRDVIELRRDKWVPRKATNVEGPMPIHQIRDEDPRGPQRGYGPHVNPPHGDVFPRKTRGGGLDMFASGNYQNVGGSPSSLGNKFDGFGSNNHNGYHQGFRNQRGGNQQPQNFFPNRAGAEGNGNGGQNRGQYQQNRSKQNHNDNNSQLQNFNNAGGNKELPPRFKNKIMMAHQQGPTNLEDLSLRPPSHSLFKQVPKSLPTQNMAVNRQSEGQGLQSRQLTPSQPLLNDSPILIKQASVEKKLPKKDKGPNKEEILKKMESIVDEYLVSATVQDAVSAYKEQKVPDKFIRCVLVFILSHSLDKTDADRELAIKLVVQLKKESLITSVQFMDAYRELTVLWAEKEKEIPRVLSHLAGFAAHAISEEVSNLIEFSNELEFGTHFPLFMLILQQLSKTQGKVKLTEIFNGSKVNLLNQLPEVDRTKDRLAEILEDRGLTFLIPLLRIQAELWKQLQSDPNPMQFYKWIKENLDVVHHTDKGFINALVTVLLKYITQETTLSDCSDKTAVPEKALIDKERFLLEKFKAVLQAFLHNQILLQVVAVYSLQVYCFSLQFPKGMLLRWFMILYDLEVIEEEAFLKWKEDISDDYPGKGQALFQVNNWLTWLEQAESEEEDDDET